MSLIQCRLQLLMLLLLWASQAVGKHASSRTRVPNYIRNIFPGPDPHFRVAPSDQKVTAGDKFARFHCVPAGAQKLHVIWRILSPDGEVVVGDRHRVSKDGTRLTIFDPMEFHDGFEIQCYLNTPFAKRPLVASAKLFVRRPQPPEIVESPRSGKHKRGSRVVLECAAQGWPLPRIGWIFESRRFKIRRFFDANKDYRDYIKEPNRLIIVNMSPESEGTYTCIAYSRYDHSKIKAYVGYDRRRVRRPNVRKIVQTLRGVYRHYRNYARDAEQKLGRKATCNMEVLNQFGWLPRPSRRMDRMTLTYDYLLAILERHRVHPNSVKSLPGEALNIDVPLLQYIKSKLNCSSSAVPAPDCKRYPEFLSKYSAPDGSCNNLKRPTWGQAGRGFQRFLQSQYELGINLPQGYQKHRRYGGFRKPSARKVSLHALRKKHYPVDKAISQVFNYFGQFLDHDIDLTPGASTDRGLVHNSDCNKHCRVDLPCFPIPAPRDDPRMKGCITFKRSAAFCSSGEFSKHEKCIRPREQINQITSFIDGSAIYGSNCEVLNLLRDLNSPSGFLKTSRPAPGQMLDLLPISVNGVPTACGRNRDSPNAKCFSAGDARANEFVLLTVYHTMFVREHNRIGHVLHSLNPHWCGDKVFYETRRIMSALTQQITYNEYLPVLIGVTGMREIVKPYKGYRSDVNPNIANCFATTVFRIGHTMISDFFALLDKKYHLEQVVQLEHGLFAPHIISAKGIDSLVRGAITVAMKSRSKGPASMSRGTVDRLFELTSKVASDLAALNIQRGRDHGLPSYNYWRQLCGLSWATKWDDLAGEISSPEALRKLEEVYGSPLNVDLFPAIVLEDRVDDSLVGPTARCVLALQFRALRDGDRFWYENPGQFTPTQLQEIRRYTLSRLICNTVETINEIQPQAFYTPRHKADLVPCSELPDIDLSAWKDFDRRKKCMPRNPCSGARGESEAADGSQVNY
ncbi:hypothetical protein BOX15_Mlig005605g1 [Macrostomum lignano]|uniref:Ig-like domain-containing protein n=2 Tax=Macrostomum lignano TaxID=282301 RepID=A0A1I8G8W8_9PLAT|nr:hypothetical protein BOX15_Mlig005605g1 [Macrostomum lignano]